MSLRPTVDFLLDDWLGVESLNQRERFADHSRETFDAVLDTCERIAREKYAPFNRTVDTQEPHFDGEQVVLPQATHDAQKAYAESGMLSAAQDYEIGGMQLPYSVEAAANAFFAMASVSIGSGMLTTGNANLLMAHGTEAQKRVFALNEFFGRWSGTMCLSEPQAGSSLSDVATRAVPDGDDYLSDPLGPRFRLKGNKMWILGRRARADGEHHSPGAGEDSGAGRQAAAGRQGHLAVRGAQEAGGRGREADRRAQRRGPGRPEPQVRLARHHQHAAQLWRRQVPRTRQRGRHRLPRRPTRRRPALACST
ncbi:MAG: acyl-CoA dehydrogenase family protein [Cellvibrionaceae bacterium]|nr:acyl-CoA dehydrogenase family protein [Cellvibrionaceae bacterium]